jgi:hypothetical protein
MRTQHLFKKDPRSLVKFIREDTPWLSDEPDSPTPESVDELYKSLWGTTPKVELPFDDTPTSHNIATEDLLHTITVDEV